jgi:hypothetical protein
MRTRIVGICGAMLVVAASCSFPTSGGPPSCDGDVDMCPHSSPAATAVTCDCHCSIGAIDETAMTYDGPFSVCLPPSLNAATAAGDDQVSLEALAPREFDQRVYRYCSREVARFVRATIKVHSLLRLAACIQPVRCDCSTKGADRDSSVCQAPCVDRLCDDQNCPTVLRKGGKLDMSLCSCTRVSICSAVSPEEDAPPMCRDWLASQKGALHPVAPAAR